MAVVQIPVMDILGQIDHQMEWFTWHDPAAGTDEIEFACTCRAWKFTETIDPIEFRGAVLYFSGRPLGVVVLKAGISAGRSFQLHLATAQVDVVQWAGQL